MFSKKVFIVLLSLLALSLGIGACASSPAPETGSTEPVTIRVAVLPILDALPMYVAEAEGLFSEHGVEIEFVPVASAPERDQIIAAGQADAMINELVSVIFYNREQVQVQSVRFAQTATAENALFSILASGSSGIQSVDGLKGAEIGISQGTVIEYVTDRLLQAQGFTPEEINTIAVPKISDRMALLGSGELAAGMLPEPLASLAALQGSRVVLDDTSKPEVSYSTITFRKAFIDENPEAVRAFLAAIEDATARINADTTQWNALLAERNVLPAPLAESFQVSPFVTAGVPSQAQWDDVMDWVKAEGLLEADVEVPYADSVTAAFLP